MKTRINMGRRKASLASSEKWIRSPYFLRSPAVAGRPYLKHASGSSL